MDGCSGSAAPAATSRGTCLQPGKHKPGGRGAPPRAGPALSQGPALGLLRLSPGTAGPGLGPNLHSGDTGSVMASRGSAQNKLSRAPGRVIKLLCLFVSSQNSQATGTWLWPGRQFPWDALPRGAECPLQPQGQGCAHASHKWLKPTKTLLLTLLARGVLKNSPAIPYRILCNTPQEHQLLDYIILTYDTKK